MRVKNSIIIIFLLFTSFLISQESKIKTFNGQVINDDVEKSGIVVINKNSGGKVITNKDGYFQIGVRLNDSIYLRSVQIKTHYIIVNEDVFLSRQQLLSLIFKIVITVLWEIQHRLVKKHKNFTL